MIFLDFFQFYLLLMLPIVAVVGRPNTGKSTLFNRMIGRRRAIESEIEGTTRDRIFEEVDHDGKNFMLVDTGGLEVGPKKDLEANIQMQSKIAIQDADIIILLLDARQPLTADDFYAAELLRKSNKTTIVVANKCDNASIQDQISNFGELGFGLPVGVSALHGFGVDELKNLILENLAKDFALDFLNKSKNEPSEKYIKIAVSGRPNTGKSTLVNAFFDQEKLLTSDIPGTTRDTTRHFYESKGQKFEILDTAGIRRRGRIQKGVEYYSVLRALKAIDEADIVIWLMDVQELLTHQDLQVAHYVLERGKGVIIAINKFDLVKEKDVGKKRILVYLQKKIPFLHYAPLVFLSALKRTNLNAIFDLALEIDKNRQIKIPKKDFELFLKKAISMYLPSIKSKVSLRILGGQQTAWNPPNFEILVNDIGKVHFSYKRYLENRLREEYEFRGTPIVLTFKTRSRQNDS